MGRLRPRRFSSAGPGPRKLRFFVGHVRMAHEKLWFFRGLQSRRKSCGPEATPGFKFFVGLGLADEKPIFFVGRHCGPRKTCTFFVGHRAHEKCEVFFVGWPTKKFGPTKIYHFPVVKVELLTHDLGGIHGDIEASRMVFFLQQGAGTGTTISSRDRNRDGGGTEVGFGVKGLSQGF